MIVYWSLYIFPALLTISQLKERKFKPSIYLIVIFIFIFILSAFRETGGDYTRYLVMLERIKYLPLNEGLWQSEPIYGAISWISQEYGLGIYGINTVCSLIYLFSFWKFIQNEPRSALIITISISYLVIVGLMGYSRQGVATGITLWATVYVRERNPLKFLLTASIAIGFHYTAIIIFPLVYLSIPKKRSKIYFLLTTLFTIMIILLTYQLIQLQLSSYASNYIFSDRYSSSGALLRSLLSAFAAIVFFWYWKKWPKSDRIIWTLYSMSALISVPMTQVSSTAVDRIGIYLIPLQLVVFGSLPTLQRNWKSHNDAVFFVILLYALVLFVWLHLGRFASFLWLPYQNLFIGIIP